MSNWKPEIRQRLEGVNLDPARENAIVEELAQYLEDSYAELRSGGATKAEGYQQTLAELSGSELLARELRLAERQIPPEPIRTRNQSEDKYDRRCMARPALRSAQPAQARRVIYRRGCYAHAEHRHQRRGLHDDQRCGMAHEISVDTRTIQSRIDEAVEGFWKLELLIKILCAIAVTLALIGIYGLVSFAVSQRTREIGVRIALGARSQDIFRAVLSSILWPVAAGLLFGLLLAFAAATLLARVTQSSRDMLFTVNAHDFIAYGVAVLLSTAVILAAMLGPARRAMRVDPKRL
jgi:fumarate reductase subunit D